MVVTNSETIANQVAELRNYGASMAAWSRHTSSLFELPVYEQAGYNYKMTDIQASLGLVQMGKLEQMIAARREIARFYDSQLGELDWLQLPQESCGFTHVYQSYVCLINRIQGEPLQSSVERRNRLWRHLAEHGIASVQGAQAMHTIHYYYQKYGWHPEDYPNAQRADLCSVALPIFPGLEQDDQERVIEAMQLFKP